MKDDLAFTARAKAQSSAAQQPIFPLERKIKLYEAREAILNRISPEVCSVIDLANFLRATVNELGKMMEADRCDFAVYEDGKLSVGYEYRRVDHLPSSLNSELSLDYYFANNSGGKSLPLVVDDTSHPLLPESTQAWCREMKTLSWMIVPVTFQNELFGIIGLHHCFKYHQWATEELNFIKSLTQQIAIAYQYTKLYTEKEKEVDITKTLLEIANDLNSKLDFRDLTSFIVDKSIDLVKADFGCVGVLDMAERALHFKSLRVKKLGIINVIEKNPVSLTDMPHLLHSINAQQTFFLNNPDRDVIARSYLREIFQGRSALVTPIITGGKVFGTLNLVWLDKKVSITPHQIKLLEGISNQTAIALENSRLSSEVVRLERQLKGVKARETIVGQSEKTRKCIEIALYVADSSTTVLLQGESGTGKELLADLIYRNSARHNRPYLKLNCGAIPETLIEAELFGYEKGAFTDAKARKIGKFEEVNTGTLFLDEIGEMSANAQVKLLRVLQDGEFTRVGGNEVVKTDVRVIAATNADLVEAVEMGRFRKDLYYRLNVYPITLPPLRDRVEDIPLIAMHFIQLYNKKNNRSVTGISEKALHSLKAYHWPGNVRELENAIERALIVAKSKIVDFEDLPDAIRHAYTKLRGKTIDIEVGAKLEDVERKMILETLGYTKGDKSKAAKMLGIGRKTLYRKLESYNGSTNSALDD